MTDNGVEAYLTLKICVFYSYAILHSSLKVKIKTKQKNQKPSQI